MYKLFRIFPLFLILFFTNCSLINRTSNSVGEPPPQTTENGVVGTGFSVPKSSIDLAKPLEVSQKPEDIARCEKINQAIDNSELANARWGVFVVSLKDGRVACARDARKLFNPASIQKTLTTIVALDTLGADYRWKTSVFASNQIGSDGVLNGDLTLYGQGAPDFDSQQLEKLVADLQAKGLKRVKGSVVGDDSFFRGDTIGDGWTWNELQWYYGAEASALNFNENQAFVMIENGAPKATTDYVQVSLGKATAQKDETNSAGISRGLADNNFYLWGQVNKDWGGRIAVHNPALWAARVLKETLEKRGIAVEGTSKSIDWKSENKLDVSKAVELAFTESQTLGEIVQKMNKHSINLFAEVILRTVGKKFGDIAPDENDRGQEVRGDDIAGTAVVEKWLRDHRVATDEIEIHDGSGLSRLDFVTPEAFGRALIYAAQAGFSETFKNSLPISGTDGTLGGRLGKVKGKILAKTGTVTYVNSLTGYALGANDETFAFAIICNNQTHKKDGSRVIDAAIINLADGGESVNEGNNNTGNKNQSSVNASNEKVKKQK